MNTAILLLGVFLGFCSSLMWDRYRKRLESWPEIWGVVFSGIAMFAAAYNGGPEEQPVADRDTREAVIAARGE